ncbi:MAG: hypothetical protein CVV05_00320 [Gammaproteobacteria bacterium HGW-Gammaproteobacteria-1]|jgi:hypothetical protein|nr:MAG: hypothetical protein CVV05_00320 [Gammaproteobacteria bacterium HGW-Gammaproteobacteria-1]
MPMIRGYHGGAEAVLEFDSKKTIDGGFHFGTYEQAVMRASGLRVKVLTEAELEFHKLQRSRDTGGHWKATIANARRRGCDGIVYLNRYEGIGIESILRAQQRGVDPDRLSDAEFRRWFPEAQDSYIAFAISQIRVTSHHYIPSTKKSSAPSSSQPRP